MPGKTQLGLRQADSISGLSVENDELVIELIRAEPNLTYYLALNFIVPVPVELIDCMNNDLSHQLIGTGPYEFLGFKEGAYYDLVKNKNY